MKILSCRSAWLTHMRSSSVADMVVLRECKSYICRSKECPEMSKASHPTSRTLLFGIMKNKSISVPVCSNHVWTDELLCSRQDVHCPHITDMTFITFLIVIVSHEGQFQRSAPFGSFLVLPGTSTEKKLKKLHIMLLSSDVHWVEHFLLIKKEWWMRKWQSTFRLLWGIHPIKPMHSKEVFQGCLIFKPLLSSLLATRRWLWIWEVWFVSLLVSVEMEFVWHSRRQRGFHVEVTLWLTRTDLPHIAQNLQRIRRTWKPRDHGKGLLFHGQVKRKKISNLWAQDVPPFWCMIHQEQTPGPQANLSKQGLLPTVTRQGQQTQQRLPSDFSRSQKRRDQCVKW